MAKETRYAWLAAGLVFMIGGAVTRWVLDNDLFWFTIFLGLIFLGIAAFGHHLAPYLQHKRFKK